MQLRNVRDRKTPELIIIPMIDIMFFLLVFFMLSTMYMIDLKPFPLNCRRQHMLLRIQRQLSLYP